MRPSPVGTSFVLLSPPPVIGLAARAEAARLRLSVPRPRRLARSVLTPRRKRVTSRKKVWISEVILMSGAIGIRALIAGDVDASTVGGSALPPIFRGAPLRIAFHQFR